MFGYLLATIALICGMVFFLYSIKYYLTMVTVLSMSRKYRNKNRKNGKNNVPASEVNFGAGAKVGTFGIGLDGHIEEVQLTAQPFVSIHIPFYNEKNVADRILTACTNMDYTNYEVVVVDDSTDETVKILDRWKSHPRVKIHHRDTRAGFKGGALKNALRIMDPRTEFIIVFDADFVPYPDTIKQFLKYFNHSVGLQLGSSTSLGYTRDKSLGVNSFNHIDNKDYVKSNIAAVQGYQWHVLNKTENWVTRCIRAEFAGSYVIERPGTELFSSLKMIAGSVYMIRADLMKRYDWGTSITEDFELTLRLYRDGYKVLFTPYIQAPSECVSTIKRLIRQRMRWAEGHTFNIKKRFWQLMRSPKMSLKEKLEVIYLSPYYLQAAFFLVGTLCWFISDALFRTHLPFWTALWGWSLVFTNLFALPLMNAMGLFMEEADRKDYLGIISFLGLIYVIVPFQAYAALKGLFEAEEGSWFRTPKSGKITDRFFRSRFRRFLEALIPGRRKKRPVAATQEQLSKQYLKLVTSNQQFDHYKIRPRRIIPGLSRIIIALLLIATITLGIFSQKVPVALTNPDTYYLRSDACTSNYCLIRGTAGGTTVSWDVRSATSRTWYSQETYPTGGNPATIAAGNWVMTYDYQVISYAAGASVTLTFNVNHTNTTGGDSTQICASATDPAPVTAAATVADRAKTICDPGALTFNANNKRLLQLVITANQPAGVNTFLLRYNRTASQIADTYLATPSVTVPENIATIWQIVAVIPFIPYFVRRFKKREKDITSQILNPKS